MDILDINHAQIVTENWMSTTMLLNIYIILLQMSIFYENGQNN